MRLMPPSVPVWFMLAAYLAAATVVSAQGPAPHQSRVEAELAEGLFNARVVEAPFAAEAVTTWTPPADSGRPVYRSRSRMFRDRAGRVRVEQTFVGEPDSSRRFRAFVWSDPSHRTVHIIDGSSGAAVRHSAGLANMSIATQSGVDLAVTADCSISFTRPQLWHLREYGGYEEEALGPQLVHGVPAMGTRFAGSIAVPLGSAAREVTDVRWVARDLGLVLKSRTEDPRLGVVEHEVTRLSLVEPAPGVFDVPADADVVSGPTLTRQWVAAFENPHALLTWRKGVAPCTPPSR
jgi:hypothetical protein